MKYCTHLSMQYSSKNKLEKEIQAFIIENDRVIIEGSQLEAYKNKILNRIKSLNQENPRCTPKEASWYMTGVKHQDFMLHNVDCVAFYIYELTQQLI